MMDARMPEGNLTDTRVLSVEHALSWVSSEKESALKRQKTGDDGEGDKKGEGEEEEIVPDLTTIHHPHHIGRASMEPFEDLMTEEGMDDGVGRYFNTIFKTHYACMNKIPDGLDDDLRPFAESIRVPRLRSRHGKTPEVVVLRNLLHPDVVKALLDMYRFSGLPFIWDHKQSCLSHLSFRTTTPRCCPTILTQSCQTATQNSELSSPTKTLLPLRKPPQTTFIRNQPVRTNRSKPSSIVTRAKPTTCNPEPPSS